MYIISSIRIKFRLFSASDINQYFYVNHCFLYGPPWPSFSGPHLDSTPHIHTKTIIQKTISNHSSYFSISQFVRVHYIMCVNLFVYICKSLATLLYQPPPIHTPIVLTPHRPHHENPCIIYWRCSLYGWRFPLPYCSGQLVKEPPPSPSPLPPPVKLGCTPLTTPE